MNLVGKIFTMLILVMSLLFMVSAFLVYKTHRNWRDEAKQAQQAVDAQSRENKELRDDREEMINRLAHERAARRSALARLETQVRQKQQDFEALNQKYTDVFAQQRSALDTMQNAQRQLSELKNQIQVLQQEILAAQQDRDQQFSRVRELTDQIHQAQGIQARLEQRMQELTQDYTRATTVLKAHDLTVDSPVDKIPPKVQGQVLAVGPEEIEISIGEDDGIKPGHTVVVSRREKYLGRAEITRVAPDRAVGRIKQRRAPIQEGDRVQTKVEIR